MWFMRFLCMLAAVAVFGCDTGTVAPEPAPSGVEQSIKSTLERLAETGNPETVNELSSYIQEDLAGVDAAKSQSLMPDLEELQSLQDPEQIKDKAQEMLSKL
jgi:hypothetical protein